MRMRSRRNNCKNNDYSKLRENSRIGMRSSRDEAFIRGRARLEGSYNAMRQHISFENFLRDQNSRLEAVALLIGTLRGVPRAADVTGSPGDVSQVCAGLARAAQVAFVACRTGLGLARYEPVSTSW